MTTDPADKLGTPEHAAYLTNGRDSRVQDALQWLTFSHLPEELQNFTRPFYQTAVELLFTMPNTPSASDEFVDSLNLLIKAKDSAMRAGIRARTGRAGSVPRPQYVVDPPKFQ